MSDTAVAVPPSPFKSILEWAASWPSWQRDALRRLIRSGELTDADINELHRICLNIHGVVLDETPVPAPVHLAEANLPTGPDATSSVTLVSLSQMTNVNRLASGQVLDLGPSTGLTIIFGENGSGKSGYARVIKKACRARGTAPDIRPDALGAGSTGPAQAKIKFRAGAAEVETPWRDGVPADPRLANVFVFDSKSALSHVGDDEPACFTPRGLDILPKLSEACDELKRRIKIAVDSEFSEIGKARLGWKARANTPVGKLLASIGDTTTDAAVEALAVFADEDKKRLLAITEVLKSDPRRKAQDTTARAARLRAFAVLAADAATALSDDQLKIVQAAITECVAADRAAQATAGPRFDESYLPGTGGDAWRRLWAIAEQFSKESAYPDKDFPETAEGARCVLCQRALDEEARTRFAAFESFVRNAARAAADNARRRMQEHREIFAKRIKLASEYAKVIADLSEASVEVQTAVKSFVDAADSRLAAVQTALSSLTWTELVSLPPSPKPDLDKVVSALDERAKMEFSADDPEERKKLAAEREALEDREWFVGVKAEILTILGRYRRATALKKAQSDTTTNQITIRSGELQELHVTQAFCDAFNREVAALGLQTLPIAMKPLSGTKGTKPFGVRLTHGTGGKLVGIASEGEERCAAIAAFMAELSQAAHRSALVFDDPVSSLDHSRRTSVARRLATEAKTRQVVIFTHDCVFLSELLDAAEEAGLAAEARHLFWNGNSPGFCDNGLPWDWQRYKERINALEVEQRQIATGWSTVPNPANIAAMRVAYSHFRATLERVLQDVIFNGVIGRFRSWIRIDNIEDVVGFSIAECQEVMRLHKRSCDVTEAHDPATAKQAPVPNPAELKADIDAMKTLVEQVKNRRKKPSTTGGTSVPAPATTS